MKKTKKSKNNTKRCIIFIILVLLIILMVIKIFFDTNTFQVNQEQFQSSKLKEGTELKILQITDVHSRVFGKDNEKVIQKVKAMDTDIIVLTGDLIDRKTQNLEDAFHLVEELVRINPDTYFVTGNHEQENPKKEDFLAGLKDRGVTILSNEHMQFEKEGQLFDIVGVDDVSTEHEDIFAAFSDIENEEIYTILLSHAPLVVQKYPDIDADLILSGHTHGGQVRIPFIGALVSPDEGLFPELQKGVYPLEGERYLYIDSGLGTTALPIRFLNQSQISLITIQSTE